MVMDHKMDEPFISDIGSTVPLLLNHRGLNEIKLICSFKKEQITRRPIRWRA